MAERLQNDRSRKVFVPAVVILSLGIAIGIWLQWGGAVLPEDDAYITFRYVNNALAGRGLVYNEGQRVCGVSSPLYMLTLSGLSAAIRSVPVDVLAVRFNFAMWGACGVLTYFLLRRWLDAPILAAVGGLTVLLDPPLLNRVGDGMESFYFVMWVLLTLLALTNQRGILAGVAAGLATLTRPEGVLLAPLIALVLLRSWKKAVASIAVIGLVVLPWVLFAWHYYGTPVPHSIVAKMRPLYPIPPGFAARQMAIQLGPLRLVALLVTSVGIFLARARKQWISAATFLVLLAVFYGVSNPFMFGWYYPPLYVSALLVVICGFMTIARSLGRWFSDVSGDAAVTPEGHRASAVVAGLLLLAIAGQYGLIGFKRPTDAPDRQRILAYKECAAYLTSHVQPGETVAAAEIGGLGWWYDGKLLDACGLVSPEAIPYLPVPADQRVAADVGAVPVRLIEDTRPAWVVSMPYFLRKGLMRSGWFTLNYELATSVPLPQPLWGDRAVMIFKKR